MDSPARGRTQPRPRGHDRTDPQHRVVARCAAAAKTTTGGLDCKVTKFLRHGARAPREKKKNLFPLPREICAFPHQSQTMPASVVAPKLKFCPECRAILRPAVRPHPKTGIAALCFESRHFGMHKSHPELQLHCVVPNPEAGNAVHSQGCQTQP